MPAAEFADAPEPEFFDDATVTSFEDHADTAVSSNVEELLADAEANMSDPVVDDATISTAVEVEDATVVADVEDHVSTAVVDAHDVAAEEPVAATAEELGLSAEELEAIEWAMEATDTGTSASIVEGLTRKVPTPDAAMAPSPLAAVGVASELRPGPIDAAALAELRRSKGGKNA